MVLERNIIRGGPAFALRRSGTRYSVKTLVPITLVVNVLEYISQGARLFSPSMRIPVLLIRTSR